MFDFLTEMPLALRVFVVLLFVLAVILGITWLVRRFGMSALGGAAARGRQPRLAVIEAGDVDSRRKLVIVRRDNVEHLIMIGGPTDILIEANIVRGQAANRDVSAARGTGTAEALARALPLDDATSWPLAPEPGAPRPRPAAAEETLSWTLPTEPQAPMPPAPPAAPRRPARGVDTLAGLAHELSRPNGGQEPAVATPRVTPHHDIPAIRPMAPMLDIPAIKTPAPAPQPAAQETAANAPAPAGGDQNLADMAQRLEAALRRPGTPAAKPAATTPTPAPASNPAQNAGLASAPRIDSVNGARDKAAKPEPAAAPDQGSAAFGSLEQEMASLLGRPTGKQ